MTRGKEAIAFVAPVKYQNCSTDKVLKIPHAPRQKMLQPDKIVVRPNKKYHITPGQKI